MRMKEERMPKRALKGYIEARRLVGKPREIWLNAVGRDAKRMLQYRTWRRSAEERDAWRRGTEEAKAQVGLQCH